MILGVLIFQLTYDLTAQQYSVVIALVFALVALSFYLNKKYGPGDLSGIKLDGPF